MARKDIPLTLHVIARAPFNLYFDGEAYAVSASNRIGSFDVLPGHADFFSMLEPGDISIETDKDPVIFPISDGILTVKNNEVLLFVNM